MAGNIGKYRSILGDKFLLKKRERTITPGTLPAPGAFDYHPWDLHRLEEHVRGRGEESVRVLIGVAFLRNAGWIGRDDPVGYEGAEYQRGEGTRNYDAAHRFPCNPTINSWGIPHFAKTHRLARALQRPLERTDFLAKIFNYADRLFEKNGACDAVADTIRFVMHEQKQDKPVHINLIRHAAAFMLLKGYEDAYARARVEAISRTPAIDLLEPGIVDRLSQVSRSTQPNLRKPTENFEIVGDALWFSELVASRDREPFMMKPETISEYAARLEALSKE